MGLLGKVILGHAVVKHAVKSANKPSTLDQMSEFGENMQSAAAGIDYLQEKARLKQLQKLEKKQAKLNKKRAKLNQNSTTETSENIVVTQTTNRDASGDSKIPEMPKMPEMPEMPDFSGFMDEMRRFAESSSSITKSHNGKTVKYERHSKTSITNDDDTE